jgi:hypothetical protein
MTKMPDHMKGIDSLPKWDPSNPTKYNYVYGDYNPADYQAFKEARQKFGQQQMKATAKRNKQIMQEANKAIKDTINSELKKMGPTRGEIMKAAKAGKTLVATTPSECFSEVSWEATDDEGQDGICTMEFARDGYLLDEPMSLEDYLDFAQADSLGKFYNASIR